MAADEQRSHGYPTAPAQVIREPTEAWVLAALRTDLWRHVALLGLLAAVMATLWDAVGRMGLSARAHRWTVVLMTSGVAVAIAPSAIYMHEVWAGLLITLSLALRRPERWVLSIVAGVAACLFREVTLPYLLVMASFACYERRVREGQAWIAAMVLVCTLLAIHWGLATAQHQPGDFVTDGWLKLGGLRFVIATARWNALFALAPSWVLAAAVAVSVIGLSGFRNPLASRAALIVIGYVVAFAIVGRPDNDYWGILYAPFIPLGWMLAPPALKDLAFRAWPRSISMPWKVATFLNG